MHAQFCMILRSWQDRWYTSLSSLSVVGLELCLRDRIPRKNGRASGFEKLNFRYTLDWWNSETLKVEVDERVQTTQVEAERVRRCFHPYPIPFPLPVLPTVLYPHPDISHPGALSPQPHSRGCPYASLPTLLSPPRLPLPAPRSRPPSIFRCRELAFPVLPAFQNSCNGCFGVRQDEYPSHVLQPCQVLPHPTVPTPHSPSRLPAKCRRRKRIPHQLCCFWPPTHKKQLKKKKKRKKTQHIAWNGIFRLFSFGIRYSECRYSKVRVYTSTITGTLYLCSWIYIYICVYI